MPSPSMTGPAHPGTSDPGVDRLRKVLGGWRDSLLDMGGRNRLLNFRHTRSTTLELKYPEAPALLSGLGRGWAFAPVEEDEGAEAQDGVSLAKRGDRPAADAARPSRQRPSPAGLVTQKTTQGSLDGALWQLRSKSGQMFNDYGLWVLWLGVGMVEWREPGAQEASAAPLLLVPVELRRDGRGTGSRLYPAEGQDRMHNPALAVRLERMGVDWSEVTGTDTGDARAVLTAAREAAARQKGWKVEDRVVLGLFASHKEAMYQDLQQNEEQILAHPLVRAVALGPDSGLPADVIGFEPPELERIDEVQLPEKIPLVLDADASQRQCIAAALDGRSFVMSGPPGTGKSQTITNMVAALMHAGRSVLFVSEKAAALDVVRNRLRGVGLGDFVLALHSGDTSKKAVATELARVLTTEVRVTGAAAHELDHARRLREELSAYAAAMNEVREPLGRTLHDVLGRLVLLEQAGTPPLTLGGANARPVRGLAAAALQDLLVAAGAVSRSWRPAADGEEFAWRGLAVATDTGTAVTPNTGTDTGTRSAPAPGAAGASPLAVAEEAAEALDDVRAAAVRRPFAGTLAEPGTVHELRQIIRTLRAGLPERAPSPGAGLPADPSASLTGLAGHFGMPEPEGPEEAFALCELADLTASADRPPRAWFDAATLRRAHEAARELREALAAEDEARAAAEDVFGEQVLAETGLPELVRRFAEDHRGLMARFSARYKADRAAVTALTRDGTWEKSLPGRLEQALAWQRAAAETARLVAAHTDLLAARTPRGTAGLAALDRALAAAGRIAELTARAEVPDRPAAALADDAAPEELPRLLAASIRNALADWCDAAETRATRWTGAATALRDLFDTGRRAQLSPLLLGDLGRARQAVDALRADRRGPEEWQAYRAGLAVLARHGADELVTRAAERAVPPARLPEVVEQAVLRAWADGVLATDERLRTTRSEDLDARVAGFQEADRRLVSAAHGAVIEACNRRRPRSFGGGEPAVITHEAGKKTRHMPVRELLGRTRDTVQAIKPCFMMSPLTVSQHLPADYHFDVVIFDEASQVRPGDAVNCIYRGRSLVVAGDSRQLPPTSFFDSAVEDDSDEYDPDVPDSFESLLDACKAGALRELPLRWHYRSRHEDLITFSNRSFYERSMVTFPGALDEGNDVGVAFIGADGVYDRGGRRDNRREAELVAERVLHHFDTRPGRTLGVVALSQAQASAIDLAVQQARISRPDLDHCFTEDRLDGFFVKNLESVQGDERDVMIMSIGYGPDEHGKLGLNFGPINKDGGWRRLNVAVTRARYRMEVVASFHGGALADSANESVQHLKRYLAYAENGPAVLAQDVVQDEDAAPDSPFEESVLAVLRGWGYRVQPQVGVAGYRIDIGVRHPELPGSYALGIECDGAMYHSSRTARDRDRLREQVLAGLGWRLHRIWGTDWYRGREAAEQRLREAVEQAVKQGPLSATATAAAAAPTAAAVLSGTAAADPATAAAAAPAVAPPDTAAGSTAGSTAGFAAGHAAGTSTANATATAVAPAPYGGPPSGPDEPRHRVPLPRSPEAAGAAASAPVEHERVPVSAPDRPWSAPYQSFVGTVASPYELHTEEARPALQRLLTVIVRTEGPLHEDLLITRTREAWGTARAGNRIRDNIRTVLRGLSRANVVLFSGDFVDAVGGDELQARLHPEDEPVRKFAHVAPDERKLALYELAAECPGMTGEELVRQTCDYFGWRRVTKDTRAGLEADIADLCAQRRLRNVDGRIRAVR
ncbi:DUF3320 domain-containing protein [Streptomyces albus]|uniref:DUF3320 domain-containing protein n=1 Tax=Streptomyces albus TaxID=1888 RepID=UPI0004CBF27F|nr:DUF3320 domain-containing protein [Streptomyces albus]